MKQNTQVSGPELPSLDAYRFYHESGRFIVPGCFHHEDERFIGPDFEVRDSCG